jgi:hypothetical protein
MRNLRKLTAVVIAIALVLTSMATAFAADTTTATVVNGDKAAVLKQLNEIYTGKDDTNPAVGLEDALEVQQAMMFLAKEFGYKAEADKMTDEDADKALAKFKDAKDIAGWAKKVVAYSAQEGILSGKVDNKGVYTVAPKETVTAVRFATLMLKAMGYDVVKFTEAVAQLKEVEGSKISGTETGDLTRDVAVGMMYGILTAKTESGKTVAENLLAADSSLQAVLSKNNLLPVNGTLAVDTVKAVANNKVAVTLKEAATAAAADFAIVKKGTTTAVAVKNVEKESDKLYIVETDALSKGTSYTLTVNGVSVNFTGLSADTTAPKIVKATSPDTNTFKIEFTDKMDYATATDIANYTWDKNIKTVKAELNDDRNVVTLTTDTAKRGVFYKLTIANVKNSDGKAFTKDSRNIQAMEDRTAPKLDKVKVLNNYLVELKFSENMEKTALETVSNYNISDLVVKSATAYKNDDKYDTVVLETETQVARKSYKLTVDNLTDNAILKNKLGKQVRNFPGATEDKTSPVVESNSSVTSENNNTVIITFRDQNKLDTATAEDISNYTITRGSETLAVISAKSEATTYPDAYKGTKKVTLTTEPQEVGKIYKLEIKGVADEFGNVIKNVGGKSPYFQFTGSNVELTPPAVQRIEYTNSNKVVIYFHKEVDKATAQDPTNYEIKDNVGFPYKAEKDSDNGKKVTLTTEELDANSEYTIVINGVEDKYGNATVNAKSKFRTGATGFTSEIPEISYIWAASNKEIQVHFDRKIEKVPLDLTVGKTGVSVKMVPAGVLDNGKTHVYVVDKATNPNAVLDSEFIIKSKNGNFEDEFGNKLVTLPTDPVVFTGNYSYTNDNPVVDSIEQVNVKKLKVTFSKDVKLTSNGTWTYKSVKDNADTHDREWYITKTSNGIFKDGEKVNIDFRPIAKDFVEFGSWNLGDAGDGKTTKTEFETYLVDTDGPTIVDVKAVSEFTIEITYDEDIDVSGNYKVFMIQDGNEKSDTQIFGSVTGKDGAVVTFKTNTALSVERNYYLYPTASAKDLAGNKESIKDIRWDFAGSNVKVYDYVKGVSVKNATEIYVATTRKMDDPLVNPTAITILDVDLGINVTSTAILNSDKDKATVTASLPFFEGRDYEVTVTYLGGGTETFAFDGYVDSANIIEMNIAANGDLILTVDDAANYTAQLFEVTTGAIVSNTAKIPNDAGKNTFTFTGQTPAVNKAYYVVLYRAEDPTFVVSAELFVVE